jgi:hypothetical protein
MLPFFRKIRFKLAENNQFFKYSRYAIGEIVLVVIGILIALQINNWNEERKSRNVEYIALTELKKSIESNIRNMDSVAIRIEHRISSIKIILRAFEMNIPYHDSLSSHFAWGMIYDRLPINTGAYESLKGSGTQIVQDDELRFLISNYFDYHIGFLQNYLRELRDDFYNYMLGYLRENFKTFVGADQIAIPKDYEELKRNETFVLSLGIFLDVQRDALNGTNAVRNRSLELLEKINNRLVKMKKE